jgi:hypothetical protein
MGYLMTAETTYERPTWAEKATLFQILNAGHDRNGNPRRRTVYYSATGYLLAACDEGYAGQPRWLVECQYRGEIFQLPEVNTTATELRDFDKIAPPRS